MREHHLLQAVIINQRQFLFGLAVLIVGSLIYLIDRPPCNTYFVNFIGISLYNSLPNIFGSIGNYLPTFVHVFSFILITASFLPSRKRYYLVISLSWFLLDCIFEVGQRFSNFSSKIVPDWFWGIPFLENTKNYFQYGTFDYFDLLAIAVGAGFAYFALLMTMKRR